MTSAVLPSCSYNRWARTNILRIPLIIVKFTYHRCTKFKIYNLTFIDYIFILMFNEGISTFPGTSLQNFCSWYTNLFSVTGWGRTGLMCFKNINVNACAGNGSFNPTRYCFLWCSFMWFSISYYLVTT